jgi:hypothetical protein
METLKQGCQNERFNADWLQASWASHTAGGGSGSLHALRNGQHVYIQAIVNDFDEYVLSHTNVLSTRPLSLLLPNSTMAS